MKGTNPSQDFLRLFTCSYLEGHSSRNLQGLPDKLCKPPLGASSQYIVCPKRLRPQGWASVKGSLGWEFTAALRACKFCRLFSGRGRQGGDGSLAGHQGSLLKSEGEGSWSLCLSLKWCIVSSLRSFSLFSADPALVTARPRHQSQGLRNTYE